jgi:ACR3 family arsenite transporter
MQVARALQKVSVGDTNVLIAIGLIVMLIPPLAKARYNRIASVAYMRRSWREISISMVQNWIVGPFVMFLLAWAILHDQPGLFDGTVMVGLARCIAMGMYMHRRNYAMRGGFLCNQCLSHPGCF